MVVWAIILAVPGVIFADSELARRHEHLRAGINIDHRFQDIPPGDISHAELRQVHSDGFTYIRVPVTPRLLVNVSGTSTYASETIDKLKRVVKRATSLGLSVIIDYHPSSVYLKEVGEGSAADREQTIRAWGLLTKALAHADPDHVFYEIYNEPRHALWNENGPAIARAVRSMAPSTTLIYGGAQLNSIKGLLELEPLPDQNVIYTFHYYDPVVFTHQGAPWSAWFKPYRDVRYPPSDAEPKTMLSLSVSLAKQGFLGQLKELMLYLGDIDHARDHEPVAIAAGWAKKHGVPLIATEIGVVAWAPRQDRLQWLSDVRTALATEGIGWAAWEFDAEFGIYPNGARDSEILSALGLGQ